jgi:tight adherence protein C
LVVLLAARPLGGAAWLAAAVAAALAYAAAPRFLASARRRVELELLDALPLHLDLMALSLEAGSSLPAALAHCAEHAPDGVLRRAWPRVILEIHGGIDVQESLRGLEQRTGVRAFGLLVHGRRAAEKYNMRPARLVRERARQAAAQHFARAEQRARAAPLKLWATLVLCLAPCTLVVLAYPMARMLAQILP